LLYGETDAEFLPAFVDAAEMKKDFTGFNVLNGLLPPLQQFTRNLTTRRRFAEARRFWRVRRITIRSGKPSR